MADERAPGLVPDIADLVRDHSRSIYRVAIAIVHDHGLAEDIVQDVLFKAWRAADPATVTPAWLRVVTRNAAIDVLRRRRFVDLPATFPDADHAAAGTERIVEGRQRLAAVWDGLRSLDPEARAMVLLRESEELSYEDLADLFGLTPSAVKAKLYRARHQLRSRLRDWSN